MKHVFLVHSNTTLIVANGVIKKEKLQKEDILFLLTRGFKNSFDYSNIDGDIFFQELEGINYLNFFKGWKQIKMIDNFIKNKINNDFTIYLPHVAHPFFQILYTNERCVAVHILEEGVNCLSKKLYDNSSSLKFSFINLFFNILGLYGKRRFFRVRSNIDFFIKKEVQTIFYYLTPNAFSEVSLFEKKEIALDFHELNFMEKKINDNSTIFVFEAIVEQGNLSMDLFFKSIYEVLNDIQSYKIYVKFHPAQNEDNIRKIYDILSEKIEVIVLDNNVILEFEFLRSKKLIIYGFTSSLLHYARLFGHKVKSYSFLWEKDKMFANFRSSNDFSIPSDK
ncbi:polysialyltransferase family glycosyltransferase [Flavobacterium mesophilum]|uniref:polysialyltransferase family glycosyltransferase n=1 Tax=Flavobacterium mesophilum TaxID=3143495 RepID=UPI0031DF9DE2